ncbi:unnamed protein product, partial [Rotaria magnacalcarata]
RCRMDWIDPDLPITVFGQRIFNSACLRKATLHTLLHLKEMIM